jgi:hypothetical protein
MTSVPKRRCVRCTTPLERYHGEWYCPACLSYCLTPDAPPVRIVRTLPPFIVVAGDDNEGKGVRSWSTYG